MSQVCTVFDQGIDRNRAVVDVEGLTEFKIRQRNTGFRSNEHSFFTISRTPDLGPVRCERSRNVSREHERATRGCI